MTDIVERLRAACVDHPVYGKTTTLALDYDTVAAAADEIERLREAIRFAVEAIDGDDIISAWERLSAALGEDKQ